VKPLDDLNRLRDEYQDREQRLAGSDVYSWFNDAYLFSMQQRQRVILTALKRQGFADLAHCRILEMGCGAGGVLKEFLAFGAPPGYLHGVDLLEDRLAMAQHALPSSHFVSADGQSLPFTDGSFDLVMQFTAISSILDPHIRKNLCQDMLRVLKKGGLLLSYDFWLNPTNLQTRGLRPAEIREYFPGCRVSFHRITLAPPIARRLVPVSWQLSAFLEKLIIFNTHYLALIHRF
jgi:ubiquinone/menaquinone biosynthesis C-methylase UbiE